MTARLLLIDDDARLTTMVVDYLQANGFEVASAGTLSAGRERLRQGAFDALLLDLMLPDGDGLDLTRELRADARTRRLPLLMLTARGEPPDRIVGLEIGADDYLAKPFSPRELLGRIRAVLRRTLAPRLVEPNDVRAYTFSGWKLDTTARSLTTPKGETVSLGGAEFRLLAILLAHAPRVLGRTELMELMRGRDLDPFDRSVDVRVSRLRQTLREDARAPQIIKTVYGEGYLIGVPVERMQ